MRGNSLPGTIDYETRHRRTFAPGRYKLTALEIVLYSVYSLFILAIVVSLIAFYLTERVF